MGEDAPFPTLLGLIGESGRRWKTDLGLAARRQPPSVTEAASPDAGDPHPRLLFIYILLFIHINQYQVVEPSNAQVASRFDRELLPHQLRIVLAICATIVRGSSIRSAFR
jgi:hypothetical protein